MKKVIIVSGANRGIGKEICRQLAEMGHDVIACSRSIEKGEHAVKESGYPMDIQALDVNDSSSIELLKKHVEDRYERVDVLINNAGIISASTEVINSEESDYKSVFNTNFFGPWKMMQSFHPLLVKSEEGRIINMSSGMGAHSELKRGGYAGYRLSKTALNGLTIQASNELQSDGIKVNAMCPGWVKTDMGGAGADREVGKGAETAVWLATEVDIPSGSFFRDKKEIPW